MKHLAISLSILSILLFGCSTDNEEPKPEPEVPVVPKPEPEVPEKEFYTVSVDAGYNFIGSLDNWVIATDINGKVLDAKAYVAGDVVKLQSTETPEKFTLHLLRVDKMVSGAPYFNLVSYNEVAAGGTWKLVKPKVTPTVDDEIVGSKHISIVNYPTMITTSEFQNIKVSGARGNQISSMTGSGYSMDINVTLLKSTTDLIVSFFKNQRSYYKKLSGPFDNQAIVLDAQLDFEKIEREMLFNYQDATYAWIGFYGFNAGDNPSNDGYILSERKDNDGHVFGYFGSIPGYDKYRTLVVYTQDNYTRTFYKFGEQLLGDPYFQTPFTSMYKSGITDFSCLVGAPNSRTSIYFHNPTTKDLTWEVVSPRSNVVPELNFAFKELPENLVTKYPSLNLNQITFKNGSAVQYIDDFTYQDYLSYRSNMNEVTKVNSNEYYAYDWH